MRYLRTEAERVSRHEVRQMSYGSTVAGGLLLICGVGAMGLLASTILGIGSPAERLIFIGLCVAFSSGQAVLELGTAHYQANLEFTRGGLVSIARSLTLLVAVCLAALLLSASGEGTAFLAMLLGGVAAATVTLVIARHSKVKARRHRLTFAELGFNAETGWLTVYSLVAAGFATIDVFIVAIILDRYDVAAFGAAQRYYAVALGAAPALEAVLRVRTSQRDIIDSDEAQLRALSAWLKRATIPVILLGGCMALLSPLVIPLIDHGRYPVSIPVFQILLVGALAYYLAMPGLNLLMAQHRHRTLAFIFGAAFAINTVGDLLFGRAIGLVGIALVATSSLVALSIVELLLAFLGARATNIANRAFPMLSLEEGR